jgi:hypothetical protein
MRHPARTAPAWALALVLATAVPAAARQGSAAAPRLRAPGAGVPAAGPGAAAGAPAAAQAGAVTAAPGPAAARAGAVAAARSGAGRRGAFVPGRVLVGFRAGTGRTARRSAAAAVAGRPLAVHGRTEVLTLDRGADVRAVARRLAARPGVAFAEPDWIRYPDACDPGVCWQLGADPGVDATAAHTAGHTGSGRTVAVIDTGVADLDDLHVGGSSGQPDRVVSRRFCSPELDTDTHCRDATSSVSFSHGTEVASLIAAADDANGITGVAPEASVRSWRVDSGGGIPVSAEVAALDEVADPVYNVDVVNLSLGGPEWSDYEQTAVEGVLAAGISVVAAAGNDGSYIPSYPAAYHGVVSAGATDSDGQVAFFSSYGKVDVVAPGVCVAVARRLGSTDQSQRSDCPADPSSDVHYDSGTSFASPLVAGTMALAATGSPVRARLAAEATARADPPVGAADVKPWAHGLVDAAAFVDAHTSGATLLALDTTGDPGTGDGQLPHPTTTFGAAAFKADGTLATSPGNAVFGGAAIDSTVAFPAPDGHGVSAVAVGSDSLDAGTRQATVTIEGTGTTATATARALRDDDQAPGVPLSGTATPDDPWRRVDGVQGGLDLDPTDDDIDDVYGIVLGAGDTLDATVTRTAGDQVAPILYEPDTTDVLGQYDHILACGGGLAFGCPTVGLHYTAPARGTYLLDVYAAAGDTDGDYRLTWTVANHAGLPITVSVAACSPNGDGVQDRCAWNAGAVTGFTVTSFVTKGSTGVLHLAGAGARSWGGHDDGLVVQPDGAYWVRILYLQAGGRSLLRAFPLTLDRVPPRIADPAAKPSPFEPQPHDGDRDTTTFALTSSEAGRLEVVVYRYASTTVVRRLVSGRQAAGRQRLTWNGRSSSGAWLRGRYSYTIEAIDAAGNGARTHRHQISIV